MVVGHYLHIRINGGIEYKWDNQVVVWVILGQVSCAIGHMESKGWYLAYWDRLVVVYYK